MLDDCFAEKHSAVCDFFSTHIIRFIQLNGKMFPSTEPCIRDTTRRSEEKKKTKTIYQLYFHANEIFAFIGHMRPMEQFLFSI